MNIDLIEKNIQYKFQNQDLITIALVHKSYLNDANRLARIKEHNERLEFLGDAVLELSVTDFLYRNLKKSEGLMTSLRSSLVNTDSLSKVGAILNLDTEMFLSVGEKAELGKARPSIVADAVEAVIGAIYLDGGYEQADNFIKNHIICYLNEIIKNQSWKDSKTLLQEYVQEKFRVTPRYKVTDSEGKDHEKVFTTGVYLGEKEVAIGQGISKQKAETEAATKALLVVKDKNFNL